MVKVLDKPQDVRSPERTSGRHTSDSPEAARETSPAIDSEEAAVQHVRSLVESSRVKEARVKIDEFLKVWPDSKPLNIAARILAPAVAKVVPPSKPQRSRIREHQWIRENARKYPGEWLLVFEDRLIASGADLNEVIEQGKAIEGGVDGVLWYQPTPEWNYGRYM